MKCKREFNGGQWEGGCGREVDNYIRMETIRREIEILDGKETVIKEEKYEYIKCFDCYVGNDQLIVLANGINEQGAEKVDNRVCKDNYWLKKNPCWLNDRKWKEYIPKSKKNEK